MQDFLSLCEVIHSVRATDLRGYIVEYANRYYSTSISNKIAEYFFICLKQSCEDNKLDFADLISCIVNDYDGTKPISYMLRLDIHRFVPLSVFEELIDSMQTEVDNAEYILIT